MPDVRVAGIIYHGLLPEADSLAATLLKQFGSGGGWWMRPLNGLDDVADLLDATDLVITIGGDGTILRGVHAAAPAGIPVLGINMGRVGFMSEIDAADAEEGLAWYLDNWDAAGSGPRIEVRAMLQAHIVDREHERFHALNDVVVGRGATVRVIDLRTVVNGEAVITYRGDGLVVATATGSTGYALALGGPVMDPTSPAFLLKPIAAHMSLQGGMLLRPDSVVQITMESEGQATLSVDGFVDRPLSEGEAVRVETSPYSARFLRRNPPNAFFRSLTRRLGMRQGAMPRRRRRTG